jgi:tetratricopeptide (TPR) repeat protein
VLEKDPKNAPAHNGLGNIYRDQKNYSQAEENYKAAISANSSYVAAYSNWAIMLMDNNKIDDAKGVITEGLEKNPGSMELNNIKKVLEE